MTDHDDLWPAMDYAGWSDTLMTFRLWTQMVGKVRIAHEPWLNHSWHVPLYLCARGLTTSMIHTDGSAFEIEFDLRDDKLVLRSSGNASTTFPLESMSVADFHAKLKRALVEIGVSPEFDGVPSEIADAIPFATDRVHSTYDAAAVRRFWRALLSIDRVFKRFRTGFVGKASPVHFFWGSFDLAVTRFSGRGAPAHPGGVPGLPDDVAREAYDQEVSSVGFWPGDDNHPEPSFYSYAYPAPERFADAAVGPAGATFSKELGEWLLPYSLIRSAEDPDTTLLEFMQSTFEAAASLAGWDRSLECGMGIPRTPRPASRG